MIKKGMRFVPTIITLTPFIIKFSCDFLRNVTVNAKSGISDALYDEATLYKSEYEVRIQTNTSKNQIRREHKKLEMTKKFGLLFDIDGVLLRGKEPIPVAADAMKMIYKVCSIRYVLFFEFRTKNI